MPIPQIVIDTNVIIAGLRSRNGSAFRLLELVGGEQFDIHLSVPVWGKCNYTCRVFRVHRSIAMSTLNIKLPDSLYRSLQKLAEQDGISTDQFIVLAVAEKISALTTESYLKARAKRGNRARYEAVLAQAPDVEPELPDRLPSP